ncbi:MAG: fructose 1,6-bisphosphatase, partial [Alphaproteobacteria bacterium]
MKVTISAIKADVGSIGGHTKPSRQMLDCVRQEVSSAVASGLLIDGFVSHTGDDIAILMTHTHGESATGVHQFAWEAFLKATKIAQEFGL